MAVHLITGDDESLLLSAVSDLVHRVVGDGDRSLMVDDFDDDEYEVRSVVDAAQTPPFLTRRASSSRAVSADSAPTMSRHSSPTSATHFPAPSWCSSAVEVGWPRR